MQDGSLLDTLYNGHGIHVYYKYTWSSIRCFTFITRDGIRRDTSNGCALSMCVSQQRQLCDFNSMDDASLIRGKVCWPGKELWARLLDDRTSSQELPIIAKLDDLPPNFTFVFCVQFVKFLSFSFFIGSQMDWHAQVFANAMQLVAATIRTITGMIKTRTRGRTLTDSSSSTNSLVS